MIVFKIHPLLYVLVLFFFFPGVSPGIELTLDQAVRIALNNNPEAVLNDLDLAIRHSDIKRKKARYIPQFSIDNTLTYSEDDPDSSDLYTTNQNYHARIEQKIPLGGELSLSMNYGRYDYSGYRSRFTNYRLGPGFSIESFDDFITVPSRDSHYLELNLFYKQSLLKNGIAGPAFAEIKESRFDYDIQKELINQFRHKLIRLVETAFYQTALEQQKIKVYQEIFSINKRLLWDLKSKHGLGLISEIDVMSAQIKMSDSNEQLVSARFSFENRANVLKALLQIEEPIAVKTIFKKPDSIYNIDDLVVRVLKLNKEISRLKSILEKEKLRVAVAKNRCLPQVDLYFGLTRKDQGVSYSDANDLEEMEYKTGILFTYPFYPVDPEQQFFQARQKLKKVMIELKSTELNITNQIKTLYRQIQLSEKKLMLQQKQVKILKTRMDLALKAFDERLVNLKIVYDSQDDRISGEQKLLYYLYEYSSLISNLNELTGQRNNQVMQ